MKKKILMLCVLLMAAGCNQIEKIQEAIAEVQEISVKVDREIALANDTIAILRTEVAENQTLTNEQKAEIEQEIATLITGLEPALEFKSEVFDQLAILQEALEKAKTQGIGGQIETGGNYLQNLAATALPPSLAPYVALIGMIGTALGGAWVKREKAKTDKEKTEHAETKTVLKDVVRSVDAVIERGTHALTADDTREILAGAQDTATREAVRKIKNGS